MKNDRSWEVMNKSLHILSIRRVGRKSQRDRKE